MKSIIFRAIFVAFLSLEVGLSPALAEHPGTSSDIQNLKQRIKALEAGQVESPAEEPSFPLMTAGKYLTLGGVLELEANYTDSDGEDDSSDLALATAELSLEVAINEQIGGHVILLYEEDQGDDALNVDEAVISLHCPKPFFGQTAAFYGGKLYVPFGKFNSNMVSDPLTLDLGETNDTAAIFALEGDLWNLRLGVFNGGTDAAGDDDQIDSLVAALEVTPMDNLSFGASYLSDLAESDSELVADTTLYGDSVAGAAAFVSVTFGPVGLDAEILGALDDFDAALVGVPDSDLTGKKPLTWNLEASFQTTDVLLLAARYEQAEDFQDDVKRYGATASYGLFRNTVLALEYLHANPDTTDTDSDTLTAQLAFEF